MGRGTTGINLLYGPLEPRSNRAASTLDDMRTIYASELGHFEPLLTEWTTKGINEEKLQALCVELRGRSVILPAMTDVARVAESNPRRYAREELPEDTLLKVVSATSGRKIRGGAPMPAQIFADADRKRYKVDLRHVAVVFPVDVAPRLPGRAI